MNIDHLRSFLEIAATGNFNRAADNLNVTQSTISARIRVLEDRLDSQLFLRERSGVILTAAGKRFERHALNAVRAWEHGRQEVRLPEGFSSIIGVGAQVSLWERLILRWVPWMRQAAPDVVLRLEADYSPSLMRQLIDGLLDIGVMYVPRNVPGFVVETLLVEKLVMTSTKSPTDSTDDRGGSDDWRKDYVFVDWGYEFTAGHRQAFPDLPTPGVSVGLGALGLQYILENGGSGYFPMRVARPLLNEGKLHLVPEVPSFQRPAYMVFPEGADDRLDLALSGLREIAKSEQED